MFIKRGLTILLLVLAAACTPMSEQGWIRIKGAAVESDGREIRHCRIDVFNAATDKRMVGQDIDGRFDIELLPSHTPVNSYYFTVKCKAFKEEHKFGPFDRTGPEWSWPLDLGDIVFRRIPG